MATYIKPEAIKDASLPIGKVAAMSENERRAFLVSLGLGKIGVVSQKQTWASDYSGYTMSNLVWGIIPQANIDLFISAGAEFNDTDAPIVKTAPWGEQVQHLPGYFYLNGLGDLSYNEIMKSYRMTGSINFINASLGGLFDIRTNFSNYLTWHGITNGINPTSVASAFHSGLEVFSIDRREKTKTSMMKVSSYYSFNSGRYIMTILDISSTMVANINTGFRGQFVYLKLHGLNTNISLPTMWLRSDCVAYIINNSTPTTAITITLHANTYARAMADPEVLSALEAHPNISLASA